MGLKASDLPPALRTKLGLLKEECNKYNVSRRDERTCDGIVFDSKKEMQYYRQLKLMERAGRVSYFLRQIPIRLPGGVKYVVDFQVFYSDGGVSYEDVKGMRTREFITKKKIVESLYPIKIVEV